MMFKHYLSLHIREYVIYIRNCFIGKIIEIHKAIEVYIQQPNAVCIQLYSDKKSNNSRIIKLKNRESGFVFHARERLLYYLRW